MSKMCACQSYNLPRENQRDVEVVLDVPSRFGQERTTVCVDACIARAVLALWDAGVWTLSSCCGHNDGERWIIVDRQNRVEAEAVLKQIGDPARIYAWELVGPDMRIFEDGVLSG